MRDPTAQTEPLTVGQRIVAGYETDLISEPCEYAEAIDAAIAAAIVAEREACARLALEIPPPEGPAHGAWDRGYLAGRLAAAAAIKARTA
jgi:hypothetical protein